MKKRTTELLKVGETVNYFLLQGSLNLPNLGESDSHCKCMGVLMDFSLIVPCYKDPRVWQRGEEVIGMLLMVGGSPVHVLYF